MKSQLSRYYTESNSLAYRIGRIFFDKLIQFDICHVKQTAQETCGIYVLLPQTRAQENIPEITKDLFSMVLQASGLGESSNSTVLFAKFLNICPMLSEN